MQLPPTDVSKEGDHASTDTKLNVFVVLVTRLYAFPKYFFNVDAA